MVSSRFSAEALSTDVKDDGIVEDTVERTEERVVLVEVIPPERGRLFHPESSAAGHAEVADW